MLQYTTYILTDTQAAYVLPALSRLNMYYQHKENGLLIVCSDRPAAILHNQIAVLAAAVDNLHTPYQL